MSKPLHPWTEQLPRLKDAVAEAVSAWLDATVPTLGERSGDIASLKIVLSPHAGYVGRIDFRTESMISHYRSHEAKK